MYLNYPVLLIHYNLATLNKKETVLYSFEIMIMDLNKDRGAETVDPEDSMRLAA
jgi:hypothetical protein